MILIIQGVTTSDININHRMTIKRETSNWVFGNVVPEREEARAFVSEESFYEGEEKGRKRESCFFFRFFCTVRLWALREHKKCPDSRFRRRRRYHRRRHHRRWPKHCCRDRASRFERWQGVGTKRRRRHCRQRRRRCFPKLWIALTLYFLLSQNVCSHLWVFHFEVICILRFFSPKTNFWRKKEK